MNRNSPLWKTAALFAALAGLAAWATANDAPHATPGQVIPIPGGEFGESPVRAERTFDPSGVTNEPARSSGRMTVREVVQNGRVVGTVTDAGLDRGAPAPLTAIEHAKLAAAERAIEAADDTPNLIRTDDASRRPFDDAVLREKDRRRQAAEPTPVDPIPGGAR